MKTAITVGVLAAVGLALWWTMSKLQGVHITGTVGGVPVNANVTGATGSGNPAATDPTAQTVGAAITGAASVINALGNAFGSGGSSSSGS